MTWECMFCGTTNPLTAARMLCRGCSIAFVLTMAPERLILVEPHQGFEGRHRNCERCKARRERQGRVA